MNEGSATRNEEEKLLDDTLVQIVPGGASQSFTTTYMNWGTYKEYLYAPATKHGSVGFEICKKYSYALEHIDIKDLLVCSQPSKEITTRTST